MCVAINLCSMLLLVVSLLLSATVDAQSPSSVEFDSVGNAATFINIADQDMVFDDRSALANEANLHSEQYSAFIHQLYHFDTDNLQKFDSLYGQHQQAAL